MNNDNIFMSKTNNVTNPKLFTNAYFKGYVVFVKLRSAGKIFCEVGSSLYGEQKYYDLDEFCGTNVIRRCATGKFGNSADTVWDVRKPFLDLAEGCADAKGLIPHYLFDDMMMRELCTYMTAEITPRTLAEVQALGSVQEDRTVANMYQTRSGKFIYVIDNVVYSEYFPIEWALSHLKVEYELDGEMVTYIMGPGTTRHNCGNCNYFGSLHGVFLGYCANCAKDYNYTRGNGFIDQGVIYYGDEEDVLPQATYLSGLDLTTLGYNPDPEEKYNTCLSGGVLPTGPDICDDQENMDPVVEDAEDKCIQGATLAYGGNVRSKKYPRRAYGMPFMKYRTVLDQEQTETITPDSIRENMDIFFAANGIEVTNNNYSFPIGPRPEWDCYRITKRPSAWFEWTAMLRRQGEQDVKLEIRLFVSNLHSAEHPAKLLLECNNVSGRSSGYWDMMSSLKSWMLGETDSPIVDFPPPVVYPDVYDEDGELLPPPPPMY